MRREHGFSLIELMVAMAIFTIAIAGASKIYLSLLTNFKQQTKISESGLENIVGLDMLRRDLEHAGDSLPWVIPPGILYSEATEPPGTGLNEGVTVAGTSDPPRMIDSMNNVMLAPVINSTDYLVIRGVSIGSNPTAQKWTYLRSDGTMRADLAEPQFVMAKDYVMVINPGNNALNQQTLVVDPVTNAIFTLFGGQGAFVPPSDPPGLTHIIYGLDSTVNTGNPLMPFNRADYFVSDFTSQSGVPSRCAAGTGVLVKAEINLALGTRVEYPLMDCVADMQVAYRFDLDGDPNGVAETNSNVLPALDITRYRNMAEQLRDQLKEVRVYILAHEGQIDPNYTYPNNPVNVDNVADLNALSGGYLGQGRSFSFTFYGIGQWQNYRWKVYTIVAKIDGLNN